jgi:hypothetical protein
LIKLKALDSLSSNVFLFGSPAFPPRLLVGCLASHASRDSGDPATTRGR